MAKTGGKGETIFTTSFTQQFDAAQRLPPLQTAGFFAANP
jgi:hypothetical protein